ncbi:MAG TPA: hypothetical protein VGE11_20390 [Pseudonocardia sp.]
MQSDDIGHVAPALDVARHNQPGLGQGLAVLGGCQEDGSIAEVGPTGPVWRRSPLSITPPAGAAAKVADAEGDATDVSACVDLDVDVVHAASKQHNVTVTALAKEVNVPVRMREGYRRTRDVDPYNRPRMRLDGLDPDENERRPAESSLVG